MFPAFAGTSLNHIYFTTASYGRGSDYYVPKVSYLCFAALYTRSQIPLLIPGETARGEFAYLFGIG